MFKARAKHKEYQQYPNTLHKWEWTFLKQILAVVRTRKAKIQNTVSLMKILSSIATTRNR